MPPLRDQTILITGASSGLGRALALQLAGHGNRFALTARREPLLATLAAELEQRGSRALVAPADALDPAACEQVLADGITAFGSIDVAVLNAGGGQALSMARTSSAEVLRIMRLNYDTAVHSFNGSKVPTR